MPTVISFFAAESGTGKTYSEVDFLVREWLPFHRGLYISNLPLDVDKIVDYVCARNKKLDKDEIRKRIEVIPSDVFDDWIERKSTVWDFLRGRKDLKGARLFIDEVHHIVKAREKEEQKTAWVNGLSMVRHAGMQICFASQTEMQIPKFIRDAAGMQLFLKPLDDEREPFSGCRFGDLYQIRAKIEGSWSSTIIRSECTKGFGGKFKVRNSRRFSMRQEIFDLYNSFSDPHSGDIEGASADDLMLPYKQFKWPRLLWWFYVRNAYGLTLRFFALCLLVWLFVFGGLFKVGSAFSVILDWGKPAQTMEKPKKNEENGIIATPPGLEADQMKLIQRRPVEEDGKTWQAVEWGEGGRVIAAGEDWVCLSDGRIYKIGDVILYGPYEGRELALVDRSRRGIVLDDGSLLWW